jgi:hypothetical protein
MTPRVSALLLELLLPPSPILDKLSYFSMSWLLCSSFFCSFLSFFFRSNRVGIEYFASYLVLIPPSFCLYFCTGPVGEGGFLLLGSLCIMTRYDIFYVPLCRVHTVYVSCYRPLLTLLSHHPFRRYKGRYTLASALSCMATRTGK